MRCMIIVRASMVVDIVFYMSNAHFTTRFLRVMLKLCNDMRIFYGIDFSAHGSRDALTFRCFSHDTRRVFRRNNKIYFSHRFSMSLKLVFSSVGDFKRETKGERAN